MKGEPSMTSTVPSMTKRPSPAIRGRIIRLSSGLVDVAIMAVPCVRVDDDNEKEEMEE